MMDDSRIIDITPKTPERLASLRRLTLIIYALYGAAWFLALTALIAIIINYVKREDAVGTIYESHFTWQIRTFWWSLLWFAIGMATLWFGVGALILLAAAVWSLYRLIKGVLYWNDNKPMPT